MPEKLLPFSSDTPLFVLFLFCLHFSHRCWHSVQSVSIFLCLSGPGQQVHSLMSMSCSPTLLIPKTHPVPHFQLSEKGVTLYREKYTIMHVCEHRNRYIDGNIVAMTAPGQEFLCVLRMFNVSLLHWLHISLQHGLISKGWRETDCISQLWNVWHRHHLETQIQQQPQAAPLF